MLRHLDPMVQLILAAIVLAVLLPVHGMAREVAQFASNVAVFVLFLLYGLRLGRHEVLSGMSNHRVLVPLILWVFLGMAAAGWLVWRVEMDWLPPTLALGFLYLGVLPSTIQAAPTYSSISGGNVATSVVAAALLNILAVFVTAPLFSLLAGKYAAEFQMQALVKVATMLLLPFVVGQVLQGWAGSWARDRKPLVSRLERIAIALAIYVAASGAVSQGLLDKVSPRAWGWVSGGVAAMLVVGYGGAWLLGRLLRLDRPDRISMLFAGAHKSAAMGAPLATLLFPPAMAGVIILPLLAYHLAQMLVAATISSYLKRLHG